MTQRSGADHAERDVVSRLPARYGCGAVEFAGSENTRYDRHHLSMEFLIRRPLARAIRPASPEQVGSVHSSPASAAPYREEDSLRLFIWA